MPTETAPAAAYPPEAATVAAAARHGITATANRAAVSAGRICKALQHYQTRQPGRNKQQQPQDQPKPRIASLPPLLCRSFSPIRFVQADPGCYDFAASRPPSCSGPGTAQPGRTGPKQAEPGSTEPGHTDPGHTEPGSTKPGPAEPGSTKPGQAEPGPADSNQPGGHVHAHLDAGEAMAAQLT